MFAEWYDDDEEDDPPPNRLYDVGRGGDPPKRRKLPRAYTGPDQNAHVITHFAALDRGAGAFQRVYRSYRARANERDRYSQEWRDYYRSTHPSHVGMSTDEIYGETTTGPYHSRVDVSYEENPPVDVIRGYVRHPSGEMQEGRAYQYERSVNFDPIERVRYPYYTIALRDRDAEYDLMADARRGRLRQLGRSIQFQRDAGFPTIPIPAVDTLPQPLPFHLSSTLDFDVDNSFIPDVDFLARIGRSINDV